MSAGGSLGAHCAEVGCHKLDFLPFTCDRCHGVFCLDHRDFSHHSCTVDITQQRQMPHCPVCQQVVFVSAGESADAVVNAHILSGCRAHLMSVVQQQVKRKQQTALRCDFADGCSNREAFATLQCKKCKLQFCLRSLADCRQQQRECRRLQAHCSLLLTALSVLLLCNPRLQPSLSGATQVLIMSATAAALCSASAGGDG
jgi:hypothetical protein